MEYFTSTRETVEHIETHKKSPELQDKIFIYICNICGRFLDNGTNWIRHMKKHEEFYHVSCGGTLKEDKQAQPQRVSPRVGHLRATTQDKKKPDATPAMVCWICNRRFSHSGQLNVHLELHYKT